MDDREKDKIYQCAERFQRLLNIEYRFIVIKNRMSREINLNFLKTDFHHLAGLQYLSDIQLPKNKKKTIEYVRKGIINDKKIIKSRFYKGRSEDEKNVEHRIEELTWVEDYLDTNNIIKIYTTRNTPYTKSLINAEYVIESSLPSRNKTVYIFLNRRKEDELHYGIVSFFEKNNVIYSGDNLYWLLKEKNIDKTISVLYKHPSYIGLQ